jgi:hypothetical protein
MGGRVNRTLVGTGLVIPELGPAFGRLVAPPHAPPGTPLPWIGLEDIRLGLVSQLFDLAGDARRWAREGDRELALATLNRQAWETAWGRALQAVAERAAATITERLGAAAREARLPGRRAAALPLDEGEIRALAARLAQGATGFHAALAELDQLAHQARSDRSPPTAALAWQEALLTVARRLEAAWLALEEALAREWLVWDQEVEDLRRWRRPLWPLVLGGVVLFGVLLYAGLALGAYVPAPGPLRAPVEAWRARWN